MSLLFSVNRPLLLLYDDLSLGVNLLNGLVYDDLSLNE